MEKEALLGDGEVLAITSERTFPIEQQLRILEPQRMALIVE